MLYDDLRIAKAVLHEFIKQAWPSIEGTLPFIDNWHIEAIAEHLEACYTRDIKKLIINVPPRSGKTSLISIAFPAWVWLHNTQEKFIYASYTNSLSLDHSLKCRRLIESSWYQNLSNGEIQLAKDQNAKGYFQNTAGGYRMATSVAARGSTGKGGNILVVDDGNSTSDSKLQLNNVNEWWSRDWSTRLNDPKNDVMIVVQQRCDANDMTGYILANDTELEWTHLMLANEYECGRKSKSQLTILGIPWKDKRTTEKQLLFPERIGEKETERYKRELGSYGYAGQFQQRPVPLEGGIIKKVWFKKWVMPTYPQFEHIMLSCDPAISDSPTASYSAVTTWGVFLDDNDIYNVILLSMWRDRVGFPELRQRLIRMSKDYKDTGEHKNLYPAVYKVDSILIEAKATGDPLIRELRLAGIPALGYQPKGDKESRVQRIAHLIENGLIWLPTNMKDKDKLEPWADEFLEAVASFPNAESRDLVDSMTQAFSKLRDSNMLSHSKNPKENDRYHKPKILY